MPKSLTLCVLAFLLFSASLRADDTLYFIGQFGNKAVIHINGHQRVINVGETSREGVTLLSVNANHAIVKYQGKKQTLSFTPSGGKTYKAREHTEVNIWADASGSFQTPGSINGQMVHFLVDTGATTVAMNEHVANKLGIDFRYSGTPTQVATASGIARAHTITLDSVRVGDIEIKNVRASVLEGSYPREVLLGMTFLSKVELKRKGKLITLRRSGYKAAPPVRKNERVKNMRKWADARQKERAEKARKKAELKKQKAEKNKRCNKLKNDLADMERGGVSWYHLDAAGERQYYSDQEVEDQKNTLRQTIKKHCR